MKKYCPQCGAKYADGQQRFCLNDGVLLSLPDPYRLVGSTLENRYRIEALVGVGGFGAVYSAQQLGTSRAVAFKILKPDVVLQAPEADDLFEGEARTAARLEHENIVTIYDAGRTGDGLSFIAMEWLEGRPLDEVLKAEGRFTIERTAQLLRPIAAALACAHAQRVVHRDLKPGNVMLCQRRGGGEQVKVVDFGIAKVMNSTAGSTISRSIGTPHYSPPEQWTRGAQIDGRADVYALGVLVFELLTQKLPFNAHSIEELIRLKLTDQPVSLRTFLPDAPTTLEAFLQRMMARDPAQRPSMVSEIPALFEAACQPAPVAQAPTMLDPTEWISGTEIKRLIEPEPAPVKPKIPEKVEEETKPRQQPPPAKAESAPAPSPVQPAPPPRKVEQTPPITLSTLPAPARRASPWRWLAGLLGIPLLGWVIYLASSNRTPTITPSSFTGQPANVPAGQDFTETINGVKLEMKAVPAGSFLMGSPDNEPERLNAEGPQHRVSIPAFAIGKYEVTQAQWQAVMGNNPSHFKGDNLPVEDVSWNNAKEFCQKLSQLTGKPYRLPSEAEWEYAARAGTTGPYAGELDTMAWYSKNSGGKTNPVGQKQVNAFGLFDMHGNVWEWCEDDWHDRYGGQYGNPPTDGSAWFTGGDSSSKVLRGGSWYGYGGYCRSAARNVDEPGQRISLIGFRVVVSLRALTPRTKQREMR